VAGKQAPARRIQAPASHPHVPAGDTAAGATRLAPGLVIVKRSISNSEVTWERQLSAHMPASNRQVTPCTSADRK
jgi:hypothetical protein